MQFQNSGDGTGSRVENKFETFDLSSRKIEQKRVAVFNLRVNDRSSNNRGSSVIHKIAIVPKVANIEEARFAFGNR